MSDVAVTHQTQGDASDDVTMVDETKRLVAELVIEIAGKDEIARARLPKGVQAVDRSVPLEDESGHRHTRQRRAEAVSREPERLRLVLKLLNRRIHLVPNVIQGMVKTSVDQPC